MRKILLTAMIIITLLLTFALTACEPPVEAGEKIISVIILNADNTATVFTERTDSLYLGQVLDEMVAEGDITMEAEDGGFGRFIGAIAGIVADTENFTTWIGVYTDETDVTLLMTEFSITYQDKTYYGTGYGIDTMPIYSGRTYIFCLQP